MKHMMPGGMMMKDKEMETTKQRAVREMAKHKVK